MRRHVAVAAFAAALSASGAAHAHQAFFARGTEDSAASAFVLDGASISRVVYVDAPCPAGPFWARIDAAPGEVVYIRLGVPLLEELRDYRPTVYLVGPDLPESGVRVPWPLPPGDSAIALPTEGAPEPRVFHEPFTGTDSWVLLEHRHVVVRNASYHVVVDPPAVEGRFWIASGTEEVGGVGEPTALLKIRPFFAAHDAPDLGQSCEEGPVPMGNGWLCATDLAAPSWPAPLAALGIALALAARRRPRYRTIFRFASAIPPSRAPGSRSS